MIRSRLKLALFSLLCAVVLIQPLGGVHVHLCLDGSAPPVALHFADGSPLLEGVDETHQDQTVDVSSPVLGKVWPPGLDGALFLVVLLLFVVLRQTLTLPVLCRISLPLAPLFLRPPLRGPPA